MGDILKITVFGAGNQDLYVNKLNLPEKFGGEPPYGGSRMAMEFAEAGHDVILAEPNKNILTDEMWKKVEKSGVKVVSDDVEGAKHGEICIFFTPFGQTLNIIKNIIDHFPENAVLCNTCTISPVILYLGLEKDLRSKRKDIGVSSMHPAAVPGTPQHKHYVIGGPTTDGKSFATEEQINKCVELSKSVNKTPYVIPSDVLSTVSDMVSLLTAVALAGVLDYYSVGKKVIKAPEKMINQQIVMALQTMASIVETSGVQGLLKALNPELLTASASSMHLMDKQVELDSSFNILKNIDPELLDRSKNCVINPTTLVATQSLIKEIKSLVGDAAAQGMIKRSTKRLFAEEK